MENFLKDIQLEEKLFFLYRTFLNYAFEFTQCQAEPKEEIL